MPRLHKSSWVVAALTLVVLVLLIVPGQITGVYSWPTPTFSHGWPAEFLKREIDWRDTPSNHYWPPNIAAATAHGLVQKPQKEPPWLAWSSWQLWHSTKTEWTLFNLIFDVGIASLVIGLSTFAWEFRRRRRGNLFQIRISDFFVVSTFVAIALTWMINHERGFREEQSFENSLYFDRGTEILCYTDYAPKWIIRLVGWENAPRSIWRIHELDISLDASNVDKIEQYVPRFSEFKYLHTVKLVTNSKSLALRVRDAIREVLPNCEIVLPNFQNQQNAPQISGNEEVDNLFE